MKFIQLLYFAEIGKSWNNREVSRRKQGEKLFAYKIVGIVFMFEVPRLLNFIKNRLFNQDILYERNRIFEREDIFRCE